MHLLCDLENSQQSQGTQNADPKGCARSDESPQHLKNAAHYHLEEIQDFYLFKYATIVKGTSVALDSKILSKGTVTLAKFLRNEKR